MSIASAADAGSGTASSVRIAFDPVDRPGDKEAVLALRNARGASGLEAGTSETPGGAA